MRTITLFLAFIFLRLISFGQAEFEPNNTILQNSASNTFTAPVSINANITTSSPDDKDFFKIDLPYCGTWNFNIVNPSGAPCVLKMYLYNAQNTSNVIINSSGTIFDFNAGLPNPVVVNCGQAIYIQIDQTSGTDLGAYSVEIQPALNSDWECNNAFYQANLLPIDTVITTKLWGYGFDGNPDRDYYKLIAPQCGVLNITALNIGGGGTTNQDIMFTVYQPDSVTAIGSVGTGSCNLTTLTGSFLVQPGVVYVKIEDNTNNGNNCSWNYDLSNTPFTLTFAFDITDACECNNRFASACEVPINSTHQVKLWGTNSTLNTVGIEDRDYYKLIAPQCGVLNITALNIGGGGTTNQDIMFTVYQPDSVTAIGSAGTSSCNLTTVTGSFLVQPGIVYVKIEDNTNNGNNCSWNYNLSNTPFTLEFEFTSLATITSPSDSICAGNALNFTAAANSSNNWNWDFGLNATPSTSSLQNPTGVVFNMAGTYPVILTVNGCAIDTQEVVVFGLPPIPVITINGNILESSTAQGNQWYFNNIPITNATLQTYTPLQNGTYKVCVKDTNNCQSCSQTVVISNVGMENNTIFQNVLIFPNPSNGTFSVSNLPKMGKPIILCLHNLLGQIIYTGKVENDMPIKVECSEGLYFLTIKTTEGVSITKKIIIEK